MTRGGLVWAAWLASVAAYDAAAGVDPATLTDDTVQAAVRAIVDELYRRRGENNMKKIEQEGAAG